jgi:hypothetical protein
MALAHIGVCYAGALRGKAARVTGNAAATVSTTFVHATG